MNLLNESLKPVIQDILIKNHIISYEELYRNAYNMVFHKYGEELYIGIREVIIDHLVQQAYLIIFNMFF